jgi:NADH:ubiquinone oxidoreductase subunit 5 (subunit L)/multisubunit Na+/H+ antiporter MnhA subunit
VHIGVFLLLRTHPFWEDMLWAKITIIVIGALTGIIATMIARVQPTVKTQIAYSSAAQIGIMFIEVALGFHWLVLIHFAGNAFLRTYQLLVSPSVLNYLVHHQYFHYHPPLDKPLSRINATFYMLGIKEWNLEPIQMDWKKITVFAVRYFPDSSCCFRNCFFNSGKYQSGFFSIME